MGFKQHLMKTLKKTTLSLLMILAVFSVVNFFSNSKNTLFQIYAGYDDQQTTTPSTIKESQGVPMNIAPVCPSTSSSRQSHLRSICEKYQQNMTYFLNRTTDYHHLIVNDRLNVIYCHIPKAGSTSFKSIAGSYRPMSKLSLTSITRKMQSYRKIILVRHPLERLYSAYNDKFVSNYHSFGLKWFKDAITTVLGKAYSQPEVKFLTFPDFVHVLLQGGSWFQSNEHWSSIVRLCHPCFIDYDIIGKLETLESDEPDILEAFGKKTFLKVNTAKSHHKPAGYRKQSLIDAYGELPSDVFKNLTDLFDYDMQLFGYGWSHNNGSTCNIKDSDQMCC